MAYQSARTEDINGFIEVRGNPISKAGVFPYLGSEIGADEPDRIYYVYRPAEELSAADTVNSFKLMPFIVDHAMLGSEAKGLTPAEKKGVHGVIGEDVYFDSPYLRGNIKIFGEAAKKLVETGAKIELSPGYRYKTDFTPGEFEGQKYDVIQRLLRANHLALVTEGRTGPDVAVLDHALCALDSKLLQEAVMADETKKVGDGLEEIKAAIAALGEAERAALLAEYAVAKDADPVPPTEPVEKAKDQDPEAIASAEEAIKGAEAAAYAVIEAVEEVKEAAEELKVATDSAAAFKKLSDAQKKLAKAKGAPVTVTAQDRKPVQVGMDAAQMVAMIADRDALASKVSGFVGAFDSARMTTEQVAAYGVQKLGIPCQAGQERIALDAWLHGRQPEHKKHVFAADHAGKSVDILAKWGNK